MARTTSAQTTSVRHISVIRESMDTVHVFFLKRPGFSLTAEDAIKLAAKLIEAGGGRFDKKTGKLLDLIGREVEIPE